MQCAFQPTIVIAGITVDFCASWLCRRNEWQIWLLEAIAKQNSAYQPPKQIMTLPSTTKASEPRWLQLGLILKIVIYFRLLRKYFIYCGSTRHVSVKQLGWMMTWRWRAASIRRPCCTPREVLKVMLSLESCDFVQIIVVGTFQIHRGRQRRYCFSVEYEMPWKIRRIWTSISCILFLDRVLCQPATIQLLFPIHLVFCNARVDLKILPTAFHFAYYTRCAQALLQENHRLQI